MASYIQGLTDVPVPVEPFQPDFGMVQKALSTLQNRYEQGFASVKNAYSQVLNAPITNSKLRGQRDAYVRGAEQQLKNLSAVDLSIPENQSAAENVFAPFWQDNRMLMDASLTKSYKREMERGFSARDSPDDKVREQYNDLSMLYLQNGLDALRDSDPDSRDFNKLQGRRWVPFHNLEKFLDEQANAEKLEINWKSANGPYLFDVKNGQRAKEPFRNWAHNKLGNNFSEQFRVMGTVETEEGIKDLMKNDATLTKEHALSKLATNVVGQLQKSYTSRSDEINESLLQIDAKMKPLLDKKLSDDTDQDEIIELFSLDRQRKTLAEQQSALGQEIDKFTKNAPQTLIDIIRSPENYFANANKERVVNGWATGRAGIESLSIDINPVFKEKNTTDYQNALLKYNYAKLDLDERIFKAKYVDTDGDGEPDTYIGGGSGGGSGGGGGTKVKKGDGSKQTLSSGINEGAGITDITQNGTALDVYREEQASRLATANDHFLSQDGVARVLTTKLGISALDARDFLSEVGRGMGDAENKLADNERFKPILASLAKESGLKINDATGVRNALVAVAGTYVAEKLKGGGKNMDSAERLMLHKYNEGLQALQAYNTSNTQAQEAIRKTLASSSEFDALKVNRSDGKLDLMGVDDVAKFFPEASYSFVDKQSKRTFSLTRQELAQFYADGKIGQAGDKDSPTLYALTIDGKKVEQVDLKFPPLDVSHLDDFNAFKPTNEVKTGLKALQDKFVTSLLQPGWHNDPYGSKKFKDLNDKLGQKIGPFLPEFENKTGKFGVRLKYDLRSDVDNEFSYRLLSELRNKDNRLGITYDGETDSDLDDAVLNLLNQGETVMEKYISAMHITTTGGPHGHPIVEFSVAPVKDTDKTDVTDDVELKDLAQKKNISIELNPNASGALSKSIRFNSGLYMYGGLIHGQEFKSDPILEAAGFKYSVLPNDDRNPTYVTVYMKRTVFDDKTGQNKPLDDWTSDRIYFANRTPDEVMGMVNGFLDAHLKGNAEANERYEAAAKTNSMTGRDRLKRGR
jgi:hypothetical protein